MVETETRSEKGKRNRSCSLNVCAAACKLEQSNIIQVHVVKDTSTQEHSKLYICLLGDGEQEDEEGEDEE